MPDMSGPALAKQFALLRPGLKVLYVSGYTDTTAYKDVPVGGPAFLQKPFTPDVFATFDAATLAAGESAQGDWVLNVSDVFDTDIGTLQFWSIGINMPAP